MHLGKWITTNLLHRNCFTTKIIALVGSGGARAEEGGVVLTRTLTCDRDEISSRSTPSHEIFHECKS